MKQNIIASIVILIIVFGIGFLLYNKTKDPSAVTDQYAYDSQTNTNIDKEGVSEDNNEVDINNNDTKTMNATLHTNKGDIEIEFFADQAPNTVANFVKLAKSGFYDGVKFHRVIKGFMIQGGDPLTKDDSKQALWGTGGPGYQFEDEIGPNNKNNIGTISMANAGPDTNGSQFFINVANNNFLDGKHTVFGRVTKGMDVVGKIENTATDSSDRPLESVVINSITLK